MIKICTNIKFLSGMRINRWKIKKDEKIMYNGSHYLIADEIDDYVYTVNVNNCTYYAYYIYINWHY